MDFKAEQKYILLSPRKVRPVVAIIKKMTPERALEVLPFIKRRPSETLLKVIKSAVANANAQNVDLKSLTFKEIQIGEGPRLKRGQPVSRGRWHPIKKRMSHIRVVLTSQEVLEKSENKKTKEVKKEETKKIEKTNKIKAVRKTTARKGTK